MHVRILRRLNISKLRRQLSRKNAIRSIAAGLLVIVLVQFVIPSDRYLPRTYVGTYDIGLRNKADVRRELEQKASSIRVMYGAQGVTIKAAEAGIRTDTGRTLAGLPELTWKDRILPLRPLYMAVQLKTTNPVVHVDASKLQIFAEQSSRRLSKSPVDATAEVKDGQLRITNDSDGLSYDPKHIQAALTAKDPYAAVSVSVKPTSIPAATQRKDLAPLEDSYKTKTAKPLKVAYGASAQTISPEEFRNWLVVAVAPDGTRQLQFNEAAVNAKIQAWAKEFNVSPGTTQISYVDDVVVSRKNGAVGRALDAIAVKKQVNEWLAAPSDTPITLASVPLAPRVVATRTYSYSSAQLQHKLNTWIQSHSGTYQVAIRELNGRGREASYNVAQQTVMASTYKIFLAFVAYQQAETGALNLRTTLPGGSTIGKCIEVMIIYSENECAVELGRYIGWAKADQIIAAAGFEGIVLNNYDENGRLKGDKLVNASQQARFLAQLSAGSLINAVYTNQLLDYMKRQTYRDGIPAGSRGAVVADKVGFLDNYIHDVGIVYGPKSTYALVIMSAGSSWDNIRDLAAAVYDFMSQ